MYFYAIFNRVGEEQNLRAIHYSLASLFNFTYALSWTFWGAVYYWLLQVKKGKLKQQDIWPVLEKAFLRSVTVIFYFCVSLVLITPFFTHNDFSISKHEFTVIHVALILLTTIFLFLHFCALVLFQRHHSGITDAFQNTLCTIAMTATPVLFMLIFMFVQDYTHSIIVPIVFIFVILPLFCSGPYILVSIIKKDDSVAEKPRDSQLLYPHFISLFLFIIPVFFEIAAEVIID